MVNAASRETNVSRFSAVIAFTKFTKAMLQRMEETDERERTGHEEEEEEDGNASWGHVKKSIFPTRSNGIIHTPVTCVIA